VLTAHPPRDRRSRSPVEIHKRESIQRLQEAMAGDRLTVEYQPIVEARSGRVVGAEALLHWRAPSREPLDLSALLAAAERSPVIYALERWVLARCGEEWKGPALTELRLNVNLSAREFDRPRLPDRLRAALSQSGLDPSRLTLEITETSAIRDPRAVAALLREMKQEGSEVWLDDFGTGHSSLEWLFRLPVDGIKIPGTFVCDVPGDQRAALITASVIDLAHQLGLRVLAEGVERPEQRDWLVERGCDHLQGFLFAPGLPAAELSSRQVAVGATA
jgi:EAL domain-containing protein (putative c-di-GMP-specific phosphodiesterase class I)